MLTQSEFIQLIGYKKKFEKNDQITLGPHPHRWTRDIVSLESHDTFLLDFSRTSIKIEKFSLNKRFKTAIILLRYCSSGIHTNPDLSTIDGAHIHLYREDYDDKFAFDPMEIGIQPTFGMEQILKKILEYTNIEALPTIQSDLFNNAN